MFDAQIKARVFLRHRFDRLPLQFLDERAQRKTIFSGKCMIFLTAFFTQLQNFDTANCGIQKGTDKLEKNTLYEKPHCIGSK